MPDPSPRDFDDFDPDLRSLLEDLIEEFESALRSGEDLSPASLIAHVDDLDAKAWLLAELREIHGRWAADRAKDGVRAFWEQLGGGRGIAADSDSTSDPDDEPDSGKDRLTRPRLDPPFEHWPAGFELIEILKPGGTAEVFVAWELDVRRRVVLKVPRQATRPARLDAGQISRVVKRFKREGRTLGRLGASGVRAIPQFHGFVWVGDGETKWPVLVMEYVRGESLSAILKARRPGFDEGLYAHLENFARDLDVIHDNGDNHLDIKPSNIHVDRDGSWTALDWGFGRKVSGGPPPDGSPADDDLGGTRGYMAPEQVPGGSGWKPRKSDVFALGVMQHRILTGLALLPAGLDQSEIDERTLKGEFGEARARLLGMVDREPMAALALACLETDPEKRPNAADVADMIKSHLETLKLEKQRREARAKARLAQAIMASVILTCSLVVVSGVAIFAYYQREDAIHAKEVASKKQTEAEAAQGVAELKTKEAQRSEFLRGVEAADVAMRAGLFDKARKLFDQAGRRPGATEADRADLDLKDLRSAMFLNDLKAVDERLATISKRTDLSREQRARLDLETAIREMHRAMNEPNAMISSADGPLDRRILELLANAEPGLDEADRLTVRGLRATTFDAATSAYQAALALEPRHPYASSYLLETNLLGGRIEDALTQTNAWAASTPGDPLPWFYRAVLLTSAGRRAEAEDALKKLRAADGAGRVIGPSTIAQCEAMVRGIAAIDDGLFEVIFKGQAAIPFAMKISSIVSVPGGWTDASLFTAPLPPNQRRVFGGFYSGMIDALGFGPLLKKDRGILAFLTTPDRKAAMAALSDTSGFIAPGQALYFQAVLMAAEPTATEGRKMAQLAAITEKLEKAAENPLFWDIRPLCLYVSTRNDLRRSDWARSQRAKIADRKDFFTSLLAASLAADAARLRCEAGTMLLRAAALPRVNSDYREKLRELAAWHGGPGMVEAVNLLDPNRPR